jgi:hypothetical protein
MTPARLWRLTCRILLYSSLAYESLNTIVLEFVTTNHVAPDAMAFCALMPAATSQSTVNFLKEGGSQFQGAAAELVTDPTNLLSNSFFSSSQHWNTAPLHYASMSDLLGADPYYSSPHSNQRCVAHTFSYKLAGLPPSSTHPS